MIKYQILPNKILKIVNDEDTFVTENLISSFNIVLPSTFGDYPIKELEFEMRAYLPNGDYISYNVDTLEKIAKVPIANDITEAVQIVKIMFIATKDGNVVGKTNFVDKPILDAPLKGEPLTPREQFDEVIAEQRQTISNQAETITEQSQQIEQDSEIISGLNAQVDELTAENETLANQNETSRETIQYMIDNPPTPKLDTPPVVTPSGIVQQIIPREGYVGLASLTVDRVTAEVDSDIQPENIKEGVEILGVEGSYNPTYGTAVGGIYITEKDIDGYPKTVVIKDWDSGGALSLPFSTVMRSRISNIIYEGINYFTEIAASAFSAYLSLTKFNIPDDVTIIGNNAFDGDTLLSEITIPNGVTHIGDYAFRNCIALDSIVFALPNSVTYIGAYAFANAHLNGFTLSPSLTTIGNHAFGETTFSNQQKIVIPHTVTNVGNEMFKNSNVSEVDFLANVTSIPTHSFSGDLSNPNVSKPLALYIGEGVTTIGANSFYGKRGLWKLHLPSTINTFGNNWNGYVVYDGGGVTELTLGNGWNLSWNVNTVIVADKSRIETSFVIGWLESLKDLTGETAKTLTIGAVLLERLTPEQIAIATNKNWNLA